MEKQKKEQIKINKEEAIEFYVIGLTTKIAMLEAKKLEVLIDTKENFEKNVVELLFSNKGVVLSLDDVANKVNKIEKIDEEIKEIDNHIKEIIQAYKSENDDIIVFE